MKKTTGPSKPKSMMKDMKPAMKIERKLVLKKQAKANPYESAGAGGSAGISKKLGSNVYDKLASKKTENIKPMGIKKSTGAGSISPYENEMTGASSISVGRKSQSMKAMKINRRAKERVAKVKEKGMAKVEKLDKKAASLRSSNPYKSSVMESRATLKKTKTEGKAKRIAKRAAEEAAYQNKLVKPKERKGGAMTPAKLADRRANRGAKAAIAAGIGAVFGPAVYDKMKKKK